MVDVPKSPGWEMTTQACVLGAGEGEVGRLRPDPGRCSWC